MPADTSRRLDSDDFGQKLPKLGPGQPMLPSRVNPSQGTGTGFSLLLPSKAFPAADEKCSIPDGQKLLVASALVALGTMILVFSILSVKFSVTVLGQHFQPKVTSARYFMASLLVSGHLVDYQRLAKLDPHWPPRAFWPPWPSGCPLWYRSLTKLMPSSYT